mmetsp:Transcript_99439/g.237158  ORF Transcript_99439/g.237158 Transcript_99439/m.237158 type:complete len:203 (+) Transcript_99439:1188-1796(+)
MIQPPPDLLERRPQHIPQLQLPLLPLLRPPLLLHPLDDLRQEHHPHRLPPASPAQVLRPLLPRDHRHVAHPHGPPLPQLPLLPPPLPPQLHPQLHPPALPALPALRGCAGARSETLPASPRRPVPPRVPPLGLRALQPERAPPPLAQAKKDGLSSPRPPFSPSPQRQLSLQLPSSPRRFPHAPSRAPRMGAAPQSSQQAIRL